MSEIGNDVVRQMAVKLLACDQHEVFLAIHSGSSSSAQSGQTNSQLCS